MALRTMDTAADLSLHGIPFCYCIQILYRALELTFLFNAWLGCSVTNYAQAQGMVCLSVFVYMQRPGRIDLTRRAHLRLKYSCN